MDLTQGTGNSSAAAWVSTKASTLPPKFQGCLLSISNANSFHYWQSNLSLISFVKLCFLPLPVAILNANVSYWKAKGGGKKRPIFYNSDLKSSSSKRLPLSLYFWKSCGYEHYFLVQHLLLLIEHLKTGLKSCLLSLCLLPKKSCGTGSLFRHFPALPSTGPARAMYQNGCFSFL